MLAQRLFLRIYLTLLASLLIFAAATLGLFYLTRDTSQVTRQRVIAEQIASQLEAYPARSPQQAQILAQWSRDWRADLALYDRDGQRLISTGRMPPRLPERLREQPSFFHRLIAPPARHQLVSLNQGQYLLYRARGRPTPPTRGPTLTLSFLGGLLILLLSLAAMAYPLTSRLTRRLEQLSQHVSQWGQGALHLRLPERALQGDDEIAQLARQFDQSAARIEQLIQANKSLLAQASHELRTPLTRIRMQLALIEPLIDHDQQAAFMQREQAIDRNLKELNQLIDQVLLNSRLEAGQPIEPTQRLNLSQLIQLECQHYPEVRVWLPEKAIYFEGQADLLRRLLRNLLDNAYQHGQPPVSVNLQQMPDQLLLTVTDQGEGIPKNEETRIFEPFVKLSTESRGSGLGLALVRGIVQAHHGQLNLVRTVKGTCFQITLPHQND